MFARYTSTSGFLLFIDCLTSGRRWRLPIRLPWSSLAGHSSVLDRQSRSMRMGVRLTAKMSMGAHTRFVLFCCWQTLVEFHVEAHNCHFAPSKDHYKTVIENEAKADWDSMVIRLKEEFLRYPMEVGWNLSTGDLGRRPSNASQGNVLEVCGVKCTSFLTAACVDLTSCIAS